MTCFVVVRMVLLGTTFKVSMTLRVSKLPVLFSITRYVSVCGQALLEHGCMVGSMLCFVAVCPLMSLCSWILLEAVED